MLLEAGAFWRSCLFTEHSSAGKAAIVHDLASIAAIKPSLTVIWNIWSFFLLKFGALRGFLLGARLLGASELTVSSNDTVIASIKPVEAVLGWGRHLILVAFWLPLSDAHHSCAANNLSS